MDIQLPQILFQIINFGVVMAALIYFLYRPILKILEERAHKVKEAQKAAEEALQARDKADETAATISAKAKKEAQAILEEAKKVASENSGRIMDKAKKQAEMEVTKAKEEFLNEKKKHLAEIREQFVSSVIASASKVLGQELDEKKHQKLIENDLDELIKAI